MIPTDDLLKFIPPEQEYNADSFGQYLSGFPANDFRHGLGPLIRQAVAEVKAVRHQAGIQLRPRVGVCGRNAAHWRQGDYAALQIGKVETVKMMSNTPVSVFDELKAKIPTLEIVTRLYDDRFGTGRIVPPHEFAAKMIPVINSLGHNICTKYECHNEPNHLRGIEGWGQTEADAYSFNAWFVQVYGLLKSACPWATFGFPGLAIPHRDLEWLDLCRPAISTADWLGYHCYWQSPASEPNNHLADFWGLRFKYYHQKYPHKSIIITEAGDSSAQNNIPLSDGEMAAKLTEHMAEVFKYPYVESCSYFILSSEDRAWGSFAWVPENGPMRPVVDRMGKIVRPT